MKRHINCVGISLAVSLILHVYVSASDQADYMAPYITFEDGKLVTKDPMEDLANTPEKIHSPEFSSEQAKIPPEADIATINVTSNQAEINVEEPVAVTFLSLASMLAGLIVAAIVYYNVRRRQHKTDSQSA